MKICNVKFLILLLLLLQSFTTHTCFTHTHTIHNSHFLFLARSLLANLDTAHVGAATVLGLNGFAILFVVILVHFFGVVFVIILLHHLGRVGVRIRWQKCIHENPPGENGGGEAEGRDERVIDIVRHSKANGCANGRDAKLEEDYGTEEGVF